MANEINVQASLSLQRGTTAGTATGTVALQASGTAMPTQSPGTKGFSNYFPVTTADNNPLLFTGLGSLAYLFIRNDSAVQVQLSTGSGSPGFANGLFATLNQYDFCLVPVNKTGGTPTIYVKGASATSVLLAAVEV